MIKSRELRNGYCLELHLASERAEPKGIGEAPATNLACIGDSFSRPWLWPFIEENDLRTIDNVGLYA